MRKTMTTLLLLTALLLSACTRADERRMAETSTTDTTSAPATANGGDANAPASGGGQAQGTLAEVKKESKEAWDATTAYMTRERDRMGREIKEALGKVEARIAELRARNDKPGSPEKAETDRQLIDLEKQRENLANLRDRAAKASRSAWNGVQENWNKLRNEVQKRLDRDGDKSSAR